MSAQDDGLAGSVLPAPRSSLAARDPKPKTLLRRAASPPLPGKVSQKPRSRYPVPRQRLGTRKGWPIPRPCRRDACATSGVIIYDTLAGTCCLHNSSCRGEFSRYEYISLRLIPLMSPRRWPSGLPSPSACRRALL